MSAPRLGLIGARRVRQGLGPFVARFLALEGAEVAAFLGTSAASVRAGADELRERAGVEARGYTNLDDLLAREELDALAILSPAETHERYLRAALAAGLHVLCEKPLVWGGEQLGARAAALVEGFAARGLLLAENCQWPEVLPAFRALHPDVGPLERFAMRLSPASRGAQMLGDSLPHPLSLVQALLPSDEASLEDLAYSDRDPAAPALLIEARYCVPGRAVPLRIELIRGERLPREASLTINGRSARRRVRLDDYAQFLEDGAREVAVEDPLRSLLRRFLADLDATRAGAPPPRSTPILQRAAMLERALRAFRDPPSP